MGNLGYHNDLFDLVTSSLISGIRIGQKQIQFPKHCVFLYLEFRTMDKVQKPSNSVCYHCQNPSDPI
jgi:hypothetical protein